MLLVLKEIDSCAYIPVSAVYVCPIVCRAA